MRAVKAVTVSLALAASLVVGMGAGEAPEKDAKAPTMMKDRWCC